ncbi:CBS domain-containing protein [Virgibacillus indicus]|uniref:CBS domain-containing protein n=1 Tax=Virgibacillus indicus TaxID=2024554 RepID=A0A265NFE9_9BACI|nr:CBS domain-containing protein [Virgibacillus indicus]OZU90199.1 CBS domain-containing protein [Virgibacillus indicus]
MKIKDFMIKDVISVSKDTTLKELLEKLVANKVGGAPVLGEDSQLLGMISDGDVIRYLQPKGRTVYDMFTVILVNERESLAYKLGHSLDQPVSKIMKRKGIMSVDPDDKIEKALSIFSRYHFKKLPVINKSNQVVGVLSRGDVIKFITNQLIKKTDE